jgi:hypothetical protein
MQADQVDRGVADTILDYLNRSDSLFRLNFNVPPRAT